MAKPGTNYLLGKRKKNDSEQSFCVGSGQTVGADRLSEVGFSSGSEPTPNHLLMGFLNILKLFV